MSIVKPPITHHHSPSYKLQLTNSLPFDIIMYNFLEEVHQKKLKHTINWDKLKSFSVGEFMEFEEKIEDSMKREIEDRLRKIAEKKLRKKKKKKKKK